MTTGPDGSDTAALEIRTARSDDRAAVLELLASSLNWVPNELFDRFFAWKHEQNPFGVSPAWVAVDGTRIVGFRTFVRWEYQNPDGRPRRAVRAVDTATHPDYQGRGIFNRLTLHALDALRSEGVDFVFNTPNDKSRPGYLKMGWREVGRLPASVRPSGLRARSGRWRVRAFLPIVGRSRTWRARQRPMSSRVTASTACCRGPRRLGACKRIALLRTCGGDTASRRSPTVPSRSTATPQTVSRSSGCARAARRRKPRSAR